MATFFTNKAVHSVGSVFNTACPGSTKDLLSSGITVTEHNYLRVYACFSAAAKFKVIRTVSGAESSEIMNADTNLAAGSAYIFDVPISTGETVNFRFTAATTDTTFKLDVGKYTG